MDGLDYHEIVIKTEEEDSVENGDRHVKFELSERLQDGNEGLLFSNECKLEMDVEKYDEFFNEDARAIYFNECNSSLIKSEKTSQLTLGSETDSDIQIEDACNKKSSYKIDVSDHSTKYGCNSAHELKHVTTPKVKSIIYERQLESNKDQARKNQNEEFMNEIESKFIIEVETYDKFDHTYAKSIYRNKINSADPITVTGKDSVNENQFDYMKQSCGKDSIQTETEENHLEHKDLHTTESPFKCDKFSLQNKIKSRLQQHQLVHTEDRPFRCDKCDYSGKNKTHLKQHQMTHSDVTLFKCDKCSFKTLIESRIQQHELEHERPYKCYKCGYSAKTKAHLKQHHTTHSVMEPFKCEKCPYQTIVKNSFKHHKLAHMDEKPFKCDKCNYSTNRRTFLIQHKNTHFKDEPFRCHECSFQTRKKWCLYHHRQVHREEGVFKCDKCSYQTIIKSHIQQHQLLHTNETSFKCDDDKCDYSAKSNVLLKHHQTTHLANFSKPEGLDPKQHINMEDHDYHQTAIKTEEEYSAENGVRDVKSKLFERLENENVEFLLTNECKLEMDIETYDEFCNEDARAICFNEVNDDIVKAEVTSYLRSGSDSVIQTVDASNQKSPCKIVESNHSTMYESYIKIKHGTEHNENSTIHENQLHQRLGDKNEQFLLTKNECKLEMDVETYDEFCNKDARAIYFEESNSSAIKVEKTSQVPLGSETNSAILTEVGSNKNPPYKTGESAQTTQYGSISKRQNQIKHVMIHKVENMHELQLESDKKRAITDENEVLMNEINSELRIDVVAFDHTYAKSSHLNKFNTPNDAKGEESSNENRLYHFDQLDNMVQKKTCEDQQKEKQLEVELYQCDKDSFQTTEAKENLLEHRYVHTKNWPLKCDKCDFVAKIESHLKWHQKIHLEVNPFKCDMCDYSARRKFDLKHHQKMNHLIMKPFKCDMCDYSSKRNFDLKQHRTINHLIVEPFKCDKCDLTTKSIRYLKQHKLMKHTEREPFKCTKCSFQTKTKYAIKIHQLVHSKKRPFKCAKCDYSTKTKYNLKLHQITHLKNKPFKCSECSFRTKRKLCLYQHGKKHREQGSFKCEYSGKSKVNMKNQPKTHDPIQA